MVEDLYQHVRFRRKGYVYSHFLLICFIRILILLCLNAMFYPKNYLVVRIKMNTT